MAVTFSGIKYGIERIAARELPPGWQVRTIGFINGDVTVRVTANFGTDTRPFERFSEFTLEGSLLRQHHGDTSGLVDVLICGVRLCKEIIERPRCKITDHEDCLRDDGMAMECIRERLMQQCPHWSEPFDDQPVRFRFRHLCAICMKEEENGEIGTV